MLLAAIREAEPWTVTSIAAGLVLLAVVVFFLVRTLRRS